jgi:hypothetical protein
VWSPQIPNFIVIDFVVLERKHGNRQNLRIARPFYRFAQRTYIKRTVESVLEVFKNKRIIKLKKTYRNVTAGNYEE